MSDERPINRRRFFREGLRELLRPLAQAAEPLAEAAKQLSALEKLDQPAPAPYTPPPPSTSSSGIWLRPPGALDEDSFLSTCSRCGECVRVCPVQAIRLDYGMDSGAGAPYIDADLTACSVCEGVQCSSACPSGALQPVTASQIAMGTAVWNDYTCLLAMGQDCTLCVDKCPLGSTAIQIMDSRVEVLGGCVGCGMCQEHCPTVPKSITVSPR